MGAIALIAGASLPSWEAAELLQSIFHARVYAIDQYRCAGVSRAEAERMSRRAFDRTFDARVSKVHQRISQKFGAAAIGKQVVLTPEYRLSASYCRTVKKLVPDAKRALARLEQIAEGEN